MSDIRRESESHSDSDSGDSWTLLEAAPSYIVPDSSSPSSIIDAAQTFREGEEKDDDTDGISVISECESETKESFECVQQGDSARVMEVAPSPVEQDSGDATKFKTYVHKRNTTASSTIDFIMLVSFVTAASLAIGFMWGVRDDRPQQNSASVNDLLSSLYKLQEENAYLRSKLRELTLAGRGYLQTNGNSTPKQCKKTSEEPLQRAAVVSAEKYVDPDAEIERSLTENEKDLADGQVRQPSSAWRHENADTIEKSVDGSGDFWGGSKLRAVVYTDRLTRDRTKESQRASAPKVKYEIKLKHETPEDELSPAKEKQSKKLKREHYDSERYKKQDTKIENNDRYENKHEVEKRSGRNNMKNGDRVGPRDKYSPDYDMHLNYIGRFSHSYTQKSKKGKKDSKTNFVIVDRESRDSKKKKTNDSVGKLVGDWLEKRSAMRRRARQDAQEMPRLRARASARWYFQRMRDREQLRA